jgi:serine/threonine protein kinase
VTAPLKFDDLKFLRTLGMGSFGRVVMVEHVPSRTPYALKCMSREFITKMHHEAGTDG